MVKFRNSFGDKYLGVVSLLINRDRTAIINRTISVKEIFIFLLISKLNNDQLAKQRK